MKAIQTSLPENLKNCKKKPVLDDGTKTFFWRGHTILVLFIMLSFLTYVSLIEKQVQDKDYNNKR